MSAGRRVTSVVVLRISISTTLSVVLGTLNVPNRNHHLFVSINLFGFVAIVAVGIVKHIKRIRVVLALSGAGVVGYKALGSKAFYHKHVVNGPRAFKVGAHLPHACDK